MRYTAEVRTEIPALLLQSLDGDSSSRYSKPMLTATYTAGWRFTNRVEDVGGWSERFTGYKFGNFVPEFTTYFERVLTHIIQARRIPPETILIVPIMPSSKPVSSPEDVTFRTAEELSKRLGFAFYPELLRQKPRASLKSQQNQFARTELIRDSYTIDKEQVPTKSLSNIQRVVLLDDLVTRGETMSEVAKTLYRHLFSRAYNMKFIGIAAGKNEAKNEFHPDISNSHLNCEVMKEIWRLP